MNAPLLRAAAFAAVCLASHAFAADVGKRYPSEKTSYVDPVTGVTVTVLTTSPASDQKIYQTHPQWTADKQYIIFRSSRVEGQGQQLYAVNVKTGDIVQLTDQPGTAAGSVNVAQKSNRIFFLRTVDNRVQMIEMNLDPLFKDSAAGAVKDASAYERVIGTLPEGMRNAGGFGLDVDEKTAYLGARGGDVGTHLPPGTELVQTVEGQRMGAGPGGIRSMNLETGEVGVVIDVPFNMGHVQTNPWVPGEIVYCHETGGDAPQRMWTVKADGTGNRPLYPENPNDWVTHEAIIRPDEVVFNLIAHQNRMRAYPAGIAVVNLRSGNLKLYGQVWPEQSTVERGRGFWHSNGSADGRWLAGDTFDGNIWLIDRRSGEMTLLSTGHVMQPDHAHPTFHPDSNEILIQSGRLSNGTQLDLMTIAIPDALKNRQPALAPPPATAAITSTAAAQ